MNRKLRKYRSNGIKVIKFYIGNNNYDKTMIFYKNGNPKQEKNYKNGILNGNLFSFWDNGIIHTRGKYKNKHRTGVWETFDEKGNLLISEEYSK